MPDPRNNAPPDPAILAQLARLNTPNSPIQNILANAPADVPAMAPYMTGPQLRSQYAGDRDQATEDLLQAIGRGDLSRMGPASTASLQSTPPGALSRSLRNRQKGSPYAQR